MTATTTAKLPRWVGVGGGRVRGGAHVRAQAPLRMLARSRRPSRAPSLLAAPACKPPSPTLSRSLPPSSHGPPFAPPPCAPQFKDHLKKTEAVSEFAMNKSLAEQRRFLPVYGVREEMLQVRQLSLPAAGWLAVWLAGWLSGWLAGWLVGGWALHSPAAGGLVGAAQKGRGALLVGAALPRTRAHTLLFTNARAPAPSHARSHQVIRENQVVVVVGETGSGKTTQMTQVRACSAGRAPLAPQGNGRVLGRARPSCSPGEWALP